MLSTVYIHSFLNIVMIVYTYLVGTVEGSLMTYHTRALCNEKEPKIPGAERDGETRSHYHKGQYY